MPVVELDGYEADDLIASYAKVVADAGGEVIVVSSDKDLMQLVTEQVSMLDPVKQLKIGPAEVAEKFGMGPERVVEIQALAGDSVDNVPGAPGIGIKTAVQLLTEFGDLDTLLARAHEIKQPKKRETLIEFADQVRLSRSLVRLADDAPLPVHVDELLVREPDAPTLAAFLEAMEFRTLARRVAEGAPANGPGLNTSGVSPEAKAKGSRWAPGLTPLPAPAPTLVPFDPVVLRLHPRHGHARRLDRQGARHRGDRVRHRNRLAFVRQFGALRRLHRHRPRRSGLHPGGPLQGESGGQCRP